MKRIQLALLFALGGCGVEVPAEDESSVTSPLVAPPSNCRVHAYTVNPETGVAAPAGHWWQYCVCDEFPICDPLTIPLEGGWTYEAWVCQ